MDWEFAFGAANLLAMACWAVLVLLPRGDFAHAFVFYCGVGLLCLAYALGISLLLGGVLDGGTPVDGAGQADFTTIAGVRAIFATDGGVVIGWIHYLAFDLFVGQWIAKDADHKHFNRFIQAPVLLLTFVAGPAGLFVWLVIRERRARMGARRRR